MKMNREHESMENLLIKGDNIKGLYYLLQTRKLKGKIDLVYIDPPFATGGNFTITDGRASTISNSRNGEIAYSDRLVGKDFVEFLRARILLLKELMSGAREKILSPLPFAMKCLCRRISILTGGPVPLH